MSAGEIDPRRRALLAKLAAKKARRHEQADRIPRRGASRAPLSFAQEALWFLDQLEPDACLHNVPGAVRLTGALDVAALERALAEIVRRHESLRTLLEDADGQPFQVVGPPFPVDLAVRDLGHLSADEREREAVRLATEEAHHVFDLSSEPPFRAFLLRLAPEEHVLVLNFHHVAVDGWSMGVFTAELVELYAAAREGRAPELSEPEIQMGDFAAWQRAVLSGDVLDRHLDYWREALAGDLAGLALPTDHPRPAMQSFRGRHCAVRLSARLSDALRELSRNQGVTPFMTLFAAFQTVLFHRTGTSDSVVGSAVAHRNRKELEGLIGFLVNMLALRTDLSGDPTFSELLLRVRDVTLGAWAHQDLPLTRIMKEVQPERDLSRNPLFQVQFSLLTPDENPAVYGYGLSSGQIETIEMADLVMTPIDVQYENSRYDVAAFLWDMPAGIQGTIEYASDLFEEGTIARLSADLEATLRRVVAAPGARLSTLTAELGARAQAEQRAAQEQLAASVKKGLAGLKRRRAGGER